MDISGEEAQRIIARATYELENMIGRSCIDYGRLLAILKGKI
jgi:hypothetical protein